MTAHRPDDHTGTCYCGQAATQHARYGTGCGNVCDHHADIVRHITRSTRSDSEPPLYPETETP